MALAARIALGDDPMQAVTRAHQFVADQLTTSRDWTLGAGRGPIAHLMSTSPGETK